MTLLQAIALTIFADFLFHLSNFEFIIIFLLSIIAFEVITIRRESK